MSQALWELSESFSFDHVLYAHDILGSRAHVRGLARGGLLTRDEARELDRVLVAIEAEFAAGTFARHDHDEDVHMAIERRATELAGPIGARLHTARSRNDQVATTLRLFTRDALSALGNEVLDLVDALVDLGDRYEGAYLPGYTHLQRAQPVLLAHHLDAHAWALLRDVGRLTDARERLNVSPLGAGALAGTSLPIDPAATASWLGFREPFANSMDAVSDRDFVAETLSSVALLGVHLSRMGEELVLWTSAEFGFASLGDDFTTGSSMLPHKKNSDVAELARAKSGRMVGNLVGLLTTLKGLPLSYNRDLQEDKEPLFDSLTQVSLVVAALAGAYRSLTFHVAVAERAAHDELLGAIDIAERLVADGMAFRRAHDLVGRAVGTAVADGVPLSEVVAATEQLAAYGDVFEVGYTLASRRSPGGAGPVALGAQRVRLDAERARAREAVIPFTPVLPSL
jgi:argininosuccinate lyase